MNATAVDLHSRAASPGAPTLETGCVLEAGRASLILLGRGCRWHAQPAASCLLAPQKGDEVLFAPLPDGRAFVLAVLTRGESEAVLHFPHGATLNSPLPLRLNSATALRLTAPETDLDAARLEVRAAKAQAVLGECGLLARTLRAAGQRLEQTFERLTARLGSSARLVRGHDETQAASSRLAVSGQAAVQAGGIEQTAAEIVRIDAPQVHIS
ncbi:DUF3540 domain-containing protein [Desulfovibrio sp. ZJ200]|uniref:DUF3540 domain-containing protein n=1 Tax=Desulfovibrio sp. ZJ200 TaxID=2709792 RepID=UPI0013EE1F91|nr:DUF3540 domain-containing protein [Desulfovibrio sp. ZJ200]